MRSSLILAAVTAALLATSCASTKIAQKKTVDVAGQKLEFGGTYDTGDNKLSLTINGDPVLNGSFPPYTPTLNLNGPYRSLQMRAECYFASVLSSKWGVVGIVSGAVQAANSRANDKCDLQVDGKVVETLYF